MRDWSSARRYMTQQHVSGALGLGSQARPYFAREWSLEGHDANLLDEDGQGFRPPRTHVDDARCAAMNSTLFAQAQRHTGALHGFIGRSLGSHARMQCQMHRETKLVSAFTADQSASSAKDHSASGGDDTAGAHLGGREQEVMTIGRVYIVGANGDAISIVGHHPGYTISQHNATAPAVHARDAIACEVASVVASAYLVSVGREAGVPRVGFNELTVRNINACAKVVLEHVLERLLFQPSSSSSNGQRGASGAVPNFCVDMGKLLSHHSRGRKNIREDCLQGVELSSRALASSAKLGGGTTLTAVEDATPGQSPNCRVFPSSSRRYLSGWRTCEMDRLTLCIEQANADGNHPDWQGIKDAHFSGLGVTTERSANAIRAKYVSRSPSPLGCTLLVHYLRCEHTRNTLSLKALNPKP